MFHSYVINKLPEGKTWIGFFFPASTSTKPNNCWIHWQLPREPQKSMGYAGATGNRRSFSINVHFSRPIQKWQLLLPFSLAMSTDFWSFPTTASQKNTELETKKSTCLTCENSLAFRNIQTRKPQRHGNSWDQLTAQLLEEGLPRSRRSSRHNFWMIWDSLRSSNMAGSHEPYLVDHPTYRK